MLSSSGLASSLRLSTALGSVSILDKFNRWYVDVIPESETGVQWNEPIAASKSRWRQNRRQQVVLFFVYILGAMAVVVIRREPATLTLSGTLLPAFGITVIYLLAYWLWGFVPTNVIISPKFVRVVHGRSVNTWKFNGPVYAHIEGGKHRALVFTKNNHDTLRVFLAPEHESAIVEYVTKLGLLRDAKAHNPSGSPISCPRAPRP